MRMDVVIAQDRASIMQLETKFLRLRTPVEIGSRFGDWQVTWLGGWTRDRLTYLVMVAKVTRCCAAEPSPDPIQ